MTVQKAASRIAILAVLGLLGASVHAQVTLGTSPYTENFDGLSGGLPVGWTVRTGASATALGATATPVLTPNSAAGATSTNWGDTSGRFFNAASATAGSTATAAAQAAATDRALAIRQTGALGDPGAAFVLQIADTLNLSNFVLNFDAQMLSVQARSTTWTVDYGFGATPTTFTSSGATFADPGAFGSTPMTVNFGSALDNNAGPVWVRVTALTASTGAGTRDTFGIDNMSLSFTSAAIPEPGSLALLGLVALPGVALLRRRK